MHSRLTLFLRVQTHRSRQGKMEKSLVSFMATYPSWQPDAAAKQLLNSLAYQPLQRTPHFPYTAHVDQLTSSMSQYFSTRSDQLPS